MKEEPLEKPKASIANTDRFNEKANRYISIGHLIPELRRLFIQHIEIGERSVKYSWSADVYPPAGLYPLSRERSVT